MIGVRKSVCRHEEKNHLSKPYKLLPPVSRLLLKLSGYYENGILYDHAQWLTLDYWKEEITWPA